MKATEGAIRGDVLGSALMSGDLAARLLAAALDRVEAHGRERLPEPLAGQWREVLERWRAKLPPGGVEAQFLGPWGTPAFPLLAWVAEAVLAEPGSEPSLLASEAMMAWYFALRVQDDIVDDGAPAERVWLVQALEARALRLMVEAAGDFPAMLAEWERLTTDFAAAALADLRLRADPRAAWGEAEVALQGRKFLPMAGPLQALLIRAGRTDALDAVRAGVERLSVGLQLTNDLAGAATDLDNGERSPFAAALGLVPGLHAAVDLEPAIRRGLRSGAYQAYVSRTEAALRSSLEPFALLPGARLIEHVEARVAALTEHARIAAVRALTGAPPLVLDLEVTRRCDLRCAACFVRARETSRSLEGAAELPLDLVDEVLDEASGYLTSLHLTGGEPFAHPLIWEILDHARARGLDCVAINTNALRLAGEGNGLERLAALGLKVRLLVSIDGPPGTHDRSRGMGVEAAAIDVLRRAPALGVEALVATILTRELVSHGLAAWLSWLAVRIGRAPGLVLWPLFLRPDEPAPPGTVAVGTPLDRAGEREAAAQLAALLREGADAVVVDGPHLNPLLLELGVPAERLKPCDAARGRLCVQADGAVSPCHPFAMELARLEPGRAGGFVARALAHPAARRLAEHGAEGCLGCAHRVVCGSCQGTIVAKGLPLFANDWRCRA